MKISRGKEKMSTMEFVCITCGGNRGVREGGFIKCKHCGNRYRLRPADDNIRISLQYALNERQDADFDKARRRYDKIIADNDGSADLEEAYWGRFLCEQYVIFYQNDAGESIPSFWNINETACDKSDSYRKALSYITKEDVAKKLFSVIAPAYANVNGGYTQVYKMRPRRGDGAETAIVKLVAVKAQDESESK